MNGGRKDRRPVERVDEVGLGRRPKDEVDDEIRFHIEARTDQLVDEGLSPEAARQRALEEFGPLESTRAAMVRHVEQRHGRPDVLGFLTAAGRDLRYALRSARTRPGAFAVAALSIALGMAAVSTMWTAVDRLILRPLPYDPDRQLVYVGTFQRGGGPSTPSAPGDFLDLREAARTVELAAYRDGQANLGGEIPEWISLQRITPGFFDVVGVPPALGRGFEPADARADGPQVALLAHGLWERRFGSRPDVIGEAIRLDGRPYTVVGVLPEGFEFGRTRNGLGGAGTSVWLPLHLEDDGRRDSWSVTVVGRMRGDLETTRRELADLGEQLATRFPDTHAERSFPANRLMAEVWGGPVIAQALGASLAAALLVLLVACANVANLLLARGADRASEISLRRALGAARGRILGQLLLESALLAVVGGALGIALSSFGVRGLAALSPDDMVRGGELYLDLRSAAVGMAIALASVVLFGVVPALRTLAAGERSRLVGGARGGLGRGGRLRTVLVAVEIGVAVVLVTTTALVVRSFDGLRGVDTGVASEGVWSFRVGLPSIAYPDDDAVRLGMERLHRVVSDLPGVDGVGIAVGMPGGGWRQLAYAHPGLDDGQRGRPRVLTRISDVDYAGVLGMEAVRGRSFTAEDDEGSALVGLVNERFAAELWGSESALGRTLLIEDQLVEIVGVVPDVREVSAMSEPRSALYLPLAQWPSRGLSVVFRPSGDAPPIAELRAAVANLNGDLAVRDVMPLDDVLLQSGAQTLALSKLLGTMALAALLLAIVGVYASTAYTVARRVPEIGLRMALGAPRARVRTRVIGGAVWVSLAGLAAGLPAAWAMGRAMSSFVFGTGTASAGPYVAVAAVLLAISVAAAWIPARRASAVDPVVALRAE